MFKILENLFKTNNIIDIKANESHIGDCYYLILQRMELVAYIKRLKANQGILVNDSQFIDETLNGSHKYLVENFHIIYRHIPEEDSKKILSFLRSEIETCL